MERKPKTELTTYEIADYLNVSRPNVVKLLNEGKLPYSRVGKHRRVPVDQVEAYKKSQVEASHTATAELQAMAQEEETKS
jgi:excisionase family DNA binding protein